jgi:hypothetical protein
MLDIIMERIYGHRICYIVCNFRIWRIFTRNGKEI